MDTKQERKEQWKSGLVGLTVLVALCLIMPAAGGFADWYNEMNADHSTAETIFTQLASNNDPASTYDMDGTSGIRLYNATEPKTWYYFYNSSTTSSALNKCNITAFTAGVPTVAGNSTAGNAKNQTMLTTTRGWPYWIVIFDYRVWDSYYDSAVRLKLNLTSLSVGSGGTSIGDWAQTVTLYWGDTAFYTKSLAAADSTLQVNIDLDTNDMREAIMLYGQTGGYLKLKIERQGYTINLAGSGIYTYSATNLVGRDDALGIGIGIVGVIGFVGAILVQPTVSLTSLLQRGGPRVGKKRGR